MEVTINPSKLNGSVKAIASKSYAHRLLICSALSDKKTFVDCSESSEDIDATIRCLNSLGAKIEAVPGGFEVTPVSNENVIKNAVLDCGESGSTYRFMLPIACALSSDAEFCLHGRLPKRPMTDLFKALEVQGCRFTGVGEPRVKEHGNLKSGEFTLPGNVSSQYISGLLFALPLIPGESVINITGNIESKDYVLMTMSALETFGADIRNDGNRFIIRGGKGYSSPGTASVEGDWSNAAFWLCAGAIGSDEIECTGLNAGSLQGDSAVIKVLKAFGADIKVIQNAVKVKAGTLCGTEINAENIPDLVPVLSVVASVANGRTVIKNASRLRIKESDRLVSVSKTLRALGANVEETDDGLIIEGVKRLKGGTVDSYSDHRIAMMAAVASTVSEGPVKILNAEAVRKSYPGFFEDFRALGGIVEERS